MGILTNLANSLAGGIIDMGLTQFANYINRSIQDGRNEDAFKAAGEAEDWLADKITGGRQRSGVLPVNGDPNAMMQLPESMGLSNAPQGPMDLTPPDEIMGRINKSQGAVQYFYPRWQQAIENDPYYVNQAALAKQQEAITSTKQSAAGTLGGKGNIGNMDIGPYITGEGSYTPQSIYSNAAKGAALVEEAKGPEWQRRHDISVADQIRVKQTPGARAIGSGDGGGPANAISPSFQNTVVGNLIKRYPKMFSEPMVDREGTPMLDASYNQKYGPNDLAMQVAQEIADVYSTTKKPNYMKIESQVVSKYRKGQGNGTPQKPTALQNLPKAQPKSEPKTTPLPTALSNVGSTQKPRSTVQALIGKAKSANWSDVQIRNAIKEEGYDPKEFGY